MSESGEVTLTDTRVEKRRLVHINFGRRFFAPKENIIVAGEYKFGDPVTRENFTALIIDSFNKSRGYPLAQQAYLEWLFANRGFDYVSSIKNLLRHNGANRALEEKEKEMLFNAYIRVNQHVNQGEFVNDDNRRRSYILSRVDEQLKYQINYGFNGPPFKGKENEINRDVLITLPVNEVLPFIKDYIKSRQAKVSAESKLE